MSWKRNVVKALLEVPIFYKIVIANTAMAGIVIATLLVFGTEAVAIVVVLASGAVNALLVRAALKVDALRRRQRELFAWTLNQAEQERGRVAHEIQESAAQRLAALAATAGNEQVSSEAAAVMQELVETAATLRPPRIQFLGLAEALAWYGRALERRLGIQVRVASDGALQHLDADVTLALFRIIEDCTETMARHDPAGIDICVAATQDVVASSVCAYRGGSEGKSRFTEAELFRLRERAACLDGALDIAEHEDSTVVHITTSIRGSHARYDSRLAG